MTSKQESYEFGEEMNRATREAWDTNAEFWDARMGEGNDFHRLLIEPTQLRLLDVRPGQVVLDVACGNGQFARKLASLGARVVACDFSPRMIEKARDRTVEQTDRIEYHVIDATDETQLAGLGERRFDAAVCTMAMMDMARIEPLSSSLVRLLKPGSAFVFSVCHPCFNVTPPKSKRLVEIEEEVDGRVETKYWMCISDYIQPSANKGGAMVGQPEPHYYFDRPMSVLFNACIRQGFVLDGIEEPVFELPPRPDRPYAWENYRGIPPVLVARMRLGR